MSTKKELLPHTAQMVKAISDNIILARKARGYSQLEIAKQIGISQNAYKMIESGTGGGNLLSYVKAVEYFGLTDTLAFFAAPQYDTIGQEYRLSKKSRNLNEK
jgi:transcriptional regulator with XRE-family HTH domain